MFTKGGSAAGLNKLLKLVVMQYGIDWTIEIGEAERRVGSQVALQGNLDPSVLYASPEVIKTEST